MLLVFHPANITPGGGVRDRPIRAPGRHRGRLPRRLLDRRPDRPARGNPMMGGGGAIPTTSTLPSLLGTWGVSFESAQVVADAKYRTTLRGGPVGVGLLSLPAGVDAPEGQRDHPRPRRSLLHPARRLHQDRRRRRLHQHPGQDLHRGRAGQFLPGLPARPGLVTTMRPDGTAYDLVLHLAGKFKTAFPDGKPGEEDAAEDDADKKEDAADKPEAADGEPLKRRRRTTSPSGSRRPPPPATSS